MPAPAGAEAPTSRPLQRSECLAHLRGTQVGRAAFPTGGLLTIVPTAYRLDGGYVILPLSGLEEAAGQVVTFQCDGYDAATGERWSLCVTGRTESRPDGSIRLAPDLLRGFAQACRGDAEASGPSDTALAPCD